MKELRCGLLTGLTLQLAIGPVFFFIVNLTLQKTIFDGFAGVLAVTFVDYFYITLAIIGIGKLLEYKRTARIFSFISSALLIVFGFLILKGVINSVVRYWTISSAVTVGTYDFLSSFTSVFLLTISSPMTIVFFTSLFASKAVEYGYTKNQLLYFGLGTGLATFLFMSLSVVAFSLIKGSIPTLLTLVLNGLVGCLLVGYGTIRIAKTIRNKTK